MGRETKAGRRADVEGGVKATVRATSSRHCDEGGLGSDVGALRSVGRALDALVVHRKALNGLEVSLAFRRVLGQRALELGVGTLGRGDAMLGQEMLEHSDVLKTAVKALAVEGD